MDDEVKSSEKEEMPKEKKEDIQNGVHEWENQKDGFIFNLSQFMWIYEYQIISQ